LVVNREVRIATSDYMSKNYYIEALVLSKLEDNLGLYKEVLERATAYFR